MKVFVTGVAGFLGSHVAEHFTRIGATVLGIDNLEGGELANVPDGVAFKRVDCLDRSGYQSMIASSDVVYHCAAAAYDGLSVFSPAYVYRNNAQASVEVITAAVAGGVGRIVYCSSMARYGRIEAPFHELQEPKPVNAYGIAKVSAEKFLANLATLHDTEYTIAVPHNIIGTRQKYDDPYRNVAAIMINRMLQGKQPIIYGDGSHRRCFSFVEDVVYCLERLGTQEGISGETFNVGPDEEDVSIFELASLIASILEFDLSPIYLPDRPTEVAVATCSADKARALLGYRTETSLESGLRAMVEWISLSGPRPFDYAREVEIPGAMTPRSWTERLI
ncbi:NAD-dependent epimerase/dehydratase family protein [Clavibacter californiensis]|uniref:NAD-dependent epimerase/dehydratase family protein n=1 Tax=Clavibacter californiensis TaxID=1401995 RepID=A0ABX9NE06_9MICO|nr:NAD-dependent epimerase/dehydratase family protein [Clavibacter californiensis]RII94863.1 NAD-dependent epimerase/dehydratase family protein [Clavibacter californiensis]UKF81694.1 NAD-dependent epimerase/dehydratase family protein [Clavibacter californiensis]